jgi:transcriptional regulator with XRE-family HTH domain
MHTFGRALRAERERAGLSQSELARRIGMRPGDVSRFARGVREPRLSTLVRLAFGLGVTPAELVDRLERANIRGGAQ